MFLRRFSPLRTHAIDLGKYLCVWGHRFGFLFLQRKRGETNVLKYIKTDTVKSFSAIHGVCFALPRCFEITSLCGCVTVSMLPFGSAGQHNSTMNSPLSVWNFSPLSRLSAQMNRRMMSEIARIVEKSLDKIFFSIGILLSGIAAGRAAVTSCSPAAWLRTGRSIFDISFRKPRDSTARTSLRRRCISRKHLQSPQTHRR